MSLGKRQRGVEVCLSEGKRRLYQNAPLGSLFLFVYLSLKNGSLVALCIRLHGGQKKLVFLGDDGRHTNLVKTMEAPETQQGMHFQRHGWPPIPYIPSVNLLNSFSAGFAASIVLTPTQSALSASKQ